MGRALRLLTFSTVATSIAGCALVSLQVGGSDVAVTEDSATDTAVERVDAGPRLLERLRERCAAARGPADYYESAQGLSTRVVGTWYYCPELGTWRNPPVGVRFEVGPDAASWTFLRYDPAGGFVDSTGVNASGDLHYLVTAGSSADGSPNVEPVSVHDTEPRNGLSLELARVSDFPYRFIADFEKSPRRMQLRELGGDPARGVFVPID